MPVVPWPQCLFSHRFACSVYNRVRVLPSCQIFAPGPFLCSFFLQLRFFLFYFPILFFLATGKQASEPSSIGRVILFVSGSVCFLCPLSTLFKLECFIIILIYCTSRLPTTTISFPFAGLGVSIPLLTLVIFSALLEFLAISTAFELLLVDALSLYLPPAEWCNFIKSQVSHTV